MAKGFIERGRKLVLIDDDQAFCTIMQSFALSRGLALDCFTNLDEMGSIGRLSDYAAAIVDYDLGSMNGIEIAEYLPIFFGDMPMVLVSGQRRAAESHKPWPPSIRTFVHKDEGPDTILDRALDYLPTTYQNASAH